MTGSRPSRSSTSIGRRSLTCTWPEAISSSAGSVFTTTGNASSALIAMRRSLRNADGVASSTSLTFSSAITLPIFSGRSTLTPCTNWPASEGLESMKATVLVAAGLVQRAQELDADACRRHR